MLRLSISRTRIWALLVMVTVRRWVALAIGGRMLAVRRLVVLLLLTIWLWLLVVLLFHPHIISMISSGPMQDGPLQRRCSALSLCHSVHLTIAEKCTHLRWIVALRWRGTIAWLRRIVSLTLVITAVMRHGVRGLNEGLGMTGENLVVILWSRGDE